MGSEAIHIAGRYNKYARNLSQSPWVDKDDVRIKESVQELIEAGLKKFLTYEKSVFSSSGREDVDVRMLGRGRPFAFKLIKPADDLGNIGTVLKDIQCHINREHPEKIRVRDLQLVPKDEVAKFLKDGQESKSKDYRALCCCSRRISECDRGKVRSLGEIEIDQKTPIRVLHRRTLTSRKRKINRLTIEPFQPDEFKCVKPDDYEHVLVIRMNTEAGTYIKEFVHGDFGRTNPSLATILGECDTDLLELDVMAVNLDWPTPIDILSDNLSSDTNLSQSQGEKMASDEKSLQELFSEALEAMQSASVMSRGQARQDMYLKSRRLFEKVSNLVESLGLFSENETIDDISTNDLKYLLVPAYLANIATSTECSPNRLETFNTAKTFILKFLRRVSDYGLLDNKIIKGIQSEQTNPLPSTLPQSLETAMQSRTEKIERYKRMKLRDDRLIELEKRLKAGQEVDDETVREYYLSLVKKWIEQSIESFENEIRPAIFFESNRGSNERPTASRQHSSSNLPKTMTIVRDELQKHVYGLGYPSRPTVTVDEFITKKINDGDLAFQAHKEVYANSLQRYAEQPTLMQEQEEQSDEEREKKEEQDDADELARKRRWDDFKDNTPRGSGNRHNMG